MSEYGPLTKKVIAYQDTIKRLVTTAKTAEDWVAPMSEFIAVHEFERIGPFLDVQNFSEYTEMVNGWAQYTQEFETAVKRVDELPHRVYFEVEERHLIGDTRLVVNSLSIFEFGADGKFVHLDVFLQQPTPAA